MEAKFSEITLGEEICSRLKKIYFNEIEWINCYQEVANKFTQFKKKIRSFFPEQTDQEIFKQIRSWTDNDIKEALELQG